MIATLLKTEAASDSEGSRVLRPWGDVTVRSICTIHSVDRAVDSAASTILFSWSLTNCIRIITMLSQADTTTMSRGPTRYGASYIRYLDLTRRLGEIPLW